MSCFGPLPRTCLILVVLSSCWAGLVSPAEAQTGTPGCTSVVEATQADALATVTVRNPCRRDPSQVVSVAYGDEVFLGHFDEAGTARVSFALFKPAKNDIKVRLGEEQAVTRSLDVPEFDSIKRVTLLWNAPVHLKLYVVEPGSRLNQVGSISEDQPNKALTRGRGIMDLAMPLPELSAAKRPTAGEQSYAVKGEDGRGVFSYYVEFASQGAAPALPFCGDGALAAVPYRLLTLENGNVTESAQYETPRLPCGQPVARPQRRIQ